MTQTNPLSYRHFYTNARAEVAARDFDYEQEVRDWYENGDGRSPEWVEAGTQEWFDSEFDDPSRMVNIGGRGYRFPSCPHGKSYWTDYDNICGPCEDSLTVAQRAQNIARQRYGRWCWLNSAPGGLGNIPRDARTDLVIWAFE